MKKHFHLKKHINVNPRLTKGGDPPYGFSPVALKR